MRKRHEYKIKKNSIDSIESENLLLSFKNVLIKFLNL
jgi:RAB protein geranylgeranyltransferase component A